jgi:hypothetical protein
VRDIETIEADRKAAKERLDELNAELHAARCAAIGYKEGDVYDDPSYGPVLITRLKFWGYNDRLSGQMYGKKRKKSGDWYADPQYIGGIPDGGTR